MTTPITSLVQAIAVTPAGRRRVALVLAGMHDARQGMFSATMDQIATAADLSKAQTRKHVHALVAEGLLAASGSVFGGTRGEGPSYVFNLSLLKQLAARTPDLFDEGGMESSDAYRFEVGSAQFLACLVGLPGSRRVVFWRVDNEQRVSFGDVALRTLLCDPRSRGGWHFHITPQGNPDVPYEQVFGLSSDQGAALAAWAQNTALGRVESLVTA